MNKIVMLVDYWNSNKIPVKRNVCEICARNCKYIIENTKNKEVCYNCFLKDEIY